MRIKMTANQKKRKKNALRRLESRFELNKKSSPVQKPRTRVIGDEPNSHIVQSRAGRHDVVTDGVGVVVCCGVCASDDVECMLWRWGFGMSGKRKKGGRKLTPCR